jgi:aminoglycoside phosphotransferase (APT) family kinase protein
VKPPGLLLASGRDADIFEYGTGLVLRRSRDGRSMSSEARTMQFLRDQRYPVPAIEEISDDGLDLVMERIDGPTMVEALGKYPWRIRSIARSLAELHHQLHRIEAPDFLPVAPVGKGTRVVHFDLHPLNVIMGPHGPVVIDWARAAQGDPAIDVALAWVLMAAGEIPGAGPKARLIGLARNAAVNAFISGFDKAEITRQLRPVVAWKANDPHMSSKEVAAMWRLADLVGAP